MSERKIVQYNPYGNMVIEHQPDHPLFPVTVNGVIVPEFPKLQMRANPIMGNVSVQHFMLESLVKAQNCYVLCSQRYEMNIQDSQNIVKHVEEFHRQFIEKCEEIKLNFKLNK